MRKQTLSATEIIFSTVKMIDKTNGNNAIYSDINNEFSDFKNDNVQCKQSVWQIGEGSTAWEIRTNGTDRQ